MRNALITMLGMRLDAVAQTEYVQPLMKHSRTELIGDTFYMEIPSAGIGFVASFDGRVSSIQLHAEGYEKFKLYSGPPIEDISFAHSQLAVRKRLGLPESTGGGEVIPFLGKGTKWDRYKRQDYSLHIRYAEDEQSIDLISLMRFDAVPS